MTTEAPPVPRLRLRVVAAYAVIYVVWGSTFLAIRIGVRELPPLLFGGARFLLAGALLTVVALWMRERFPRTPREWRYMLLFSFMLITFSNGISTIALVRIPSNEGALLSAGWALWSTWLGALGPKGHKLTLRGTLGLLLGLAGVVLLGVTYNAARIALSERGRELATLRVLGFTRAEISYILLGEVALLTFVALPLGCAAGFGLASLIVRAFETELYRVPLVILPSTYGWAMVIGLTATAVSAFLVRRRVDRLDLIAVLKTRE